jgi:hypothetical protein
MIDRKVAVRLLAAAVGLGVLADVLFDGRALGLNVLLFSVCFVGALALLLRASSAPLHQGRRWMALPLLVFSAAFLLHDSGLLTTVNLLALAGAIALGGLRRTRHRPQDATVGDYAAGLAAASAGSVAGAALVLRAEIPWGEAATTLRGERARGVVRGLAIGTPVVAVFGALFFAADSIFAGYVSAVVPNVGAQPVIHVVFAAVAAWLTAGLLRDLLAAREEDRPVSADAVLKRRVRLPIGETEVVITLLALDALFLAFVIVQAGYLFGGSGLVEARAHLTYAEYARHGFFELVVVSLLVLPVLLAANALVRTRSVRVLSAVLVALELVVALSALQRLRIYQQQYGLTELRLYAVSVVLWLICVFVWASVTILRNRVRRFAVGAVLAGFVATAALNALSPDALIARTNVSRPRVDVTYLARLGDDAVPTLVARASQLPPAKRTELLALLAARRPSHDGWLSWNLSRSKARDALATLR